MNFTLVEEKRQQAADSIRAYLRTQELCEHARHLYPQQRLVVPVGASSGISALAEVTTPGIPVTG